MLRQNSRAERTWIVRPTKPANSATTLSNRKKGARTLATVHRIYESSSSRKASLKPTSLQNKPRLQPPKPMIRLLG
jgi:hypothetical protein